MAKWPLSTLRTVLNWEILGLYCVFESGLLAWCTTVWFGSTFGGSEVQKMTAGVCMCPSSILLSFFQIVTPELKFRRSCILWPIAAAMQVIAMSIFKPNKIRNSILDSVWLYLWHINLWWTNRTFSFSSSSKLCKCSFTEFYSRVNGAVYLFNILTSWLMVAAVLLFYALAIECHKQYAIMMIQQVFLSADLQILMLYVS